MNLIDTHAHVHDARFEDDRDAIVARMHEAGVATAVTVGCDCDDSHRALKAAVEYGLYASAGIHPHEAKDAPRDIAAAFAPLLENRRVVAIGETGLDYYYDHSPREVQRRVLRSQIALARERGYPVIFHHRDAFADFVAILREEWNRSMRGVVHCFTGDVTQAKTYTEEFGLYLGIGGVVTFKSAEGLREAVAAAGADKLVLETDCPYLAPVPYRGQRNEPAFIVSTARQVAAILSLDVEDLAQLTQRNAHALFDLA